jgi:hypothetical protein
MSYRALLVKGQWVTGENPYGYPIGERLPLFMPFQKFNWMKVQGLLSSEKPQVEAPQVETPKGKKK